MPINENSQLLPKQAVLQITERGRSTSLAAPAGANNADDHHQVRGIGRLGSIAVAVNSLAGPAILQLPFQYQQSVLILMVQLHELYCNGEQGIVPTTCCLIFVAVLSAYCSFHTANTISMINGNAKFTKCIEFSDPYRIFWHERAYTATQVLFYLTATCLNIAAIIDTANVVDASLGLHYKTYAYSFDRGTVLSWYHAPCSRREVKETHCDPFADTAYYGNCILTLGYIITALVLLPICLKDLKENANWQVFGFLVLVTSSAYFCYSFWDTGKLSLHHVSVMGHRWTGMLGVTMFNFTLCMAVPAWLTEKDRTVSATQTIVESTFIALILYIGVGLIVALAISHVNIDVLDPMVSGAYGYGVQFVATVFAFFIIGLDIPLFSVLTRYNLTHSGLCSEQTANWLVVWIPWLLSWLFYQGDAIATLLSWGGVFLTSTVAFILPLYLSILALQQSSRYSGSVRGAFGPLMDKTHQRQFLYCLLAVSTLTVLIAIGGQIDAAEHVKRCVHSPEYYNSTIGVRT